MSDSTGLLIIRAWTEEGPSKPLRAQIRLTTDVSTGIQSTLTLARAEEVCATVQEWLTRISSRSLAGQPARHGPPDTGDVGGVALLGSLGDVDSEAVLVGYQTARVMVRAAGPRDLRNALVALVERLGGTVGPAAEQDDEVLPVDLSMGEGPPVLPRAPALSPARMRIERILPGLVEDARALAHR